ncbi:MAG: hypothetical protein Q7S06_00375 [Nanoarchaeota archaeon]|nr:hypothetical protein [Nanoarchaeota archaeon]
MKSATEIKQVRNLEDLREIHVDDAVEVPTIEARGIVYGFDKLYGWMDLIEDWGNGLLQVMYVFNRDEIILNSSTLLKKDVEKYEAKLREVGVIK